MPLIVPFHVGERVEGFLQPPGSQVLEPALPAGSAPERMIVLFRELANRVAEDGASLVYTGDCMAPLGVLAGLQRRGLTPFVVWLDAHGDFNTWETSPSGYIGGMPLAMAVGLGDQSIVDGLELQRLEPRRVVLSDARDVDPEESVALAGSGVRMAGIGEVGDCVPGDRPIYVHLDVDVITPGEMPALRFPAAGGPSLTQVAEALRVLARTERIVCATIGCTWDPSRPRAAEAFAATQSLVASLSSLRSSA